MKNKWKQLKLFYFKEVIKRDYFTITVDGKVVSYVFLKYQYERV